MPEHDCRFCACVVCYPWEEAVHNFRHKGNSSKCSCGSCPAEKPYYPAPATEPVPPSTPSAPS